MDADRFDALTRSLTGAASSRRRLLTGVAGSALGALATTLEFANADATHFECLHVGKHCTRSGQCCSSRCRGPRGRKTCRAHDVGTCAAEKAVCAGAGPGGCGGGACDCYRTTGGANYCAMSGVACMACIKDAQCATATGIPGSACVDFTHDLCTECGDGIPTGCARPCPA